MMVKTANIPEALTVLINHPWKQGHATEVHDFMLTHIAGEITMDLCEWLTKASRQKYSSSWSVAVDFEKTPDKFRSICEHAKTIYVPKKKRGKEIVVNDGINKGNFVPGCPKEELSLTWS